MAFRAMQPLNMGSQLQTDCKRPGCDEPSETVTRRHAAGTETARQRLVWDRPAPADRMLGKLITQRSQVQILSPRRSEAAGHGPAASFTSARSASDPGQTANGLQTQEGKQATVAPA